MREIKFRGKEENSGEWVYGFYEQGSFVNIVTGKDTVRHIIQSDFLYDIAPDTLGQFSGLHDKNGKEIFEGDVVQWSKDNRKYVVKFRSGMFYASVEELNERIHGGFPLFVLCDEDQPCAIVGNIYDNPNIE